MIVGAEVDERKPFVPTLSVPVPVTEVSVVSVKLSVGLDALPAASLANEATVGWPPGLELQPTQLSEQGSVQLTDLGCPLRVPTAGSAQHDGSSNSAGWPTVRGTPAKPDLLISSTSTSIHFHSHHDGSSSMVSQEYHPRAR